MVAMMKTDNGRLIDKMRGAVFRGVVCEQNLVLDTQQFVAAGSFLLSVFYSPSQGLSCLSQDRQ